MNQAMTVLTSTETVVWNTPIEMVRRIREVVGDIDLDPASNPLAQSWIRAADWYGPEHPDPTRRDGLNRKWSGQTVFLNPPFGRVGNRSMAGLWFEKAESELRAGRIGNFVILTHARYGYPWFSKRIREYWTVTTDGCPHFLDAQGNRGTGSKTATTLFFSSGVREGRLFRNFDGIGRIVPPDRLFAFWRP